MTTTLLDPSNAALVVVDAQAGLAFGVGSEDRQTLRNNLVALARTAKVFDLAIVVSSSRCLPAATASALPMSAT